MVKTAAISKPSLLRLVLLLALATTLLSVAIGWQQNWAWSAVLAALLGGAIATLASAWFRWRAFLEPRANGSQAAKELTEGLTKDQAAEQEARRILASMYQAAFMRVLLVGTALALAFKLGDQLNKPVLLAVFIVISLLGVAYNSCTSIERIKNSES